MNDYFERSLVIHEQIRGKIAVFGKGFEGQMG